MDALKRANEIRTRRAQLKRDLKAGRVEHPRAAAGAAGFVETAKVFDLLLAVPKYGRVKANKVLSSAASRRARRSAGSRSASAPSSSRCSAASAQSRLARVFVITGPSGVGKGTLIRGLLARIPELELSVSATTRHRGRASDGVDYHFLTDEEFDRKVAAGEFVEHADVLGPALRDAALRARTADRRGAPVVLEIEVQGARQVRETLPEAVQVFIAPPSEDALRERLVGPRHGQARGDRAAPRGRRARARAQREFEHVVVNDRQEEAVSRPGGARCARR